MIRTILVLTAVLAFSTALPADAPRLGPRTRLAGEELEMSVDVWGIGLVVLDWDGDGLADVVATNWSGELYWYRNVGTKETPKLGRAQRVGLLGTEAAGTGNSLTWSYDPGGGTKRPRLASVDWNADGLEDIVFWRGPSPYRQKPEEKPAKLWVLLKRKDGTVAAPTDVRTRSGKPLGEIDGATQASAVSVACADLTGDGKFDLVLSKQGGQVLLYANAGAPGAPEFADEPVVLVEKAGNIPAAAVTDWNGDGKLDLVVGVAEGRNAFTGVPNGRVKLYLNTGAKDTPKFDAGANLQANGKDVAFEQPAVPCVADWNADGRKDLIVGTEFQFTLFLNKGTDAAPVLAAAEKIKGTGLAYRNGGWHNWAPFIADLDGDGLPDLVCKTDTDQARGGFRWFKNSGTKEKPLFRTGQTLINSHVQCSRWGVVDWDADGRPDVLYTNKGASALILYHNTGKPGEPAFPVAPREAYQGKNLPEHVEQVKLVDGTPLLAGMYFWQMLDFDGDGLFDVVSLQARGFKEEGLVWFKNAGKPGTPALQAYQFIAAKDGKPIKGGDPFWVVDWNGDGVMDLLLGDYSASPTLRLGEGRKGEAPTLGAPVPLKTADGKPMAVPPERCTHATAGDLNGDGVLEVIYAYAYPGCYDIYVYYGSKP